MPTDNRGNQGQGNPGNQNPEKKQAQQPGSAPSGSEADKKRNLENESGYNRDKDLRQTGSRQGRTEMGEMGSANKTGFGRNPDDASDEVRGANENLDASKAAERSNRDKEQNDLGNENPKRSPDRDF